VPLRVAKRPREPSPPLACEGVHSRPPTTETDEPRARAADWTNRLARCVGGLAVFGIGVALILQAELGFAPWDMLHKGISDRTGINVGVVIVIVGLLLLALWIPLRQPPGVGTVLNAVEIGLVVALVAPHLPDTDRLVPRVAFLLAGILAIAIGSGFYIGSGLGAGPRDGIMVGLSQRGVSIRLARTIIEVTVGLAGILLGVRPGVGTVLFMFGIGPLVQVFLPRLSLPPRAGRRERSVATAPLPSPRNAQ
jgi:uncharacterized membrane protein YczE